MKTYSELAHKELSRSGVRYEPRCIRLWEDIDDLQALVDRTSSIRPLTRVRRQRSTFVTELGQRAYQLSAMGAIFVNGPEIVCADAEWRLKAALQADTDQNRSWRLPLFVTIGTQACGVIKFNGERTCYGLADVPELNLYRDVWHGVVKTPHYESVVGSEAMTIPAHLLDFKPHRLSHFVVPSEERVLLDTLGDNHFNSNLVTESEDIDRLASEMYERAGSIVTERAAKIIC